MKLKKGDTIKVTAGRDKGQTGKIEKVFPSREKLLVSGVNLVKRHLKKRDEKNPGGIVEIPKPLPFASVALICPACKKLTRIGYLVAKEEKIRVCRKCGHKI